MQKINQKLPLCYLRLAFNQLVGEVPPCIASLNSLAHLSLAGNNLLNMAGALHVLARCDNLAVLLLGSCFHGETALNDDGLMHLTGFQNLQFLSLASCKLKGHIPPWIARLKKLKILNLFNNNFSGPIPTWLSSMPSLLLLNLTQNTLSGELPPEMGRIPAMNADDTTSDLSYFALPYFLNSVEYRSMYYLRRGLRVGGNNLSGRIPDEIGQLKLLQELDLSNNHFIGSIPEQLSNLTNLETLNISGNQLRGEIPTSLTQLHFMSSFSVAYNDLEGRIPSGGQFDTFPADSFEGNPRLCGYILNRSCTVVEIAANDKEEEKYYDWVSWYNLPFGLGYSVGIVSVAIASLAKSCC